MTKAQANRLFVEAYYGDTNALRRALKQDRLAVNYAWQCFIDALCKDGEITQEQFANWTFPY